MPAEINGTDTATLLIGPDRLGRSVAVAGSILAHGVHLDREQVRRCAELGSWLPTES
jgi:hypothetical protein